VTEPDPQVARVATFEFIENQMWNGNPLESKQTYDRMIADKHSDEKTMKMFGCTVSSEIFDVVKRDHTVIQQMVRCWPKGYCQNCRGRTIRIDSNKKSLNDGVAHGAGHEGYSEASAWIKSRDSSQL
jgi:hypothetical protein